MNAKNRNLVEVTAPRFDGEQGVTQPSRVSVEAEVRFWSDGTYEVIVDGATLTDGSVADRKDWMAFIKELLKGE